MLVSKYLFLILPVLLFILQFKFTQNSLVQIRYEELGESVRDVYWFSQRLVYDNISTDVGFFAQLFIFYEIFGFSIFAAKWFRLTLSLISVICATYLTLKYIGPKYGWMPLVAYFLSPTLVYFVTIQSEYGLDLQYLPIFLFLIDRVSLVKSKWQLFWVFILFALLMLNWMGYPIFLFYLPTIFTVFLMITRRIVKKDRIRAIFVATIAFLVPLVFMFVYTKNRLEMIYDPNLGGGLFRGGGKLEIGSVLGNIKALLTDLFVRGNSYYFEVKKTDFSDFYPIATIFLVCVVTYLIWSRERKRRIILVSIFSLLVFNFLVSVLTLDVSEPGLRRFTGVLASFYLLFALSCYWLSRQKIKNTVISWGFLIILALIPLHHLLVYRQNLEAIKLPSAWGTQPWFSSFGTPDKSLKIFVDEVQKSDLKLSCLDGNDLYIEGCRYGEIYAAIAGSCLWNNLNCHQILAYDEKVGDYIPLTVDLWENNYFAH